MAEAADLMAGAKAAEAAEGTSAAAEDGIDGPIVFMDELRQHVMGHGDADSLPSAFREDGEMDGDNVSDEEGTGDLDLEDLDDDGLEDDAVEEVPVNPPQAQRRVASPSGKPNTATGVKRFDRCS